MPLYGRSLQRTGPNLAFSAMRASELQIEKALFRIWKVYEDGFLVNTKQNLISAINLRNICAQLTKTD